MRCNKCGQFLQEDSKFCGYCGNALEGEPNSAEDQLSVLPIPKHTTGKRRVLPGVLTGVLLLSITLNVVQAVYGSTAKTRGVQQITTLSAAVAEKDAEISALTETVKKKENRIETLKVQIDILRPQANYYKEISKEFRYSNPGYADENFYASHGIFVTGKDELRKFSITTDFPTSETVSIECDSDIADVSFESSSWNTRAYVVVQPKKEGMTLATFRCEAEGLEFKVIIIVIKDKVWF